MDSDKKKKTKKSVIAAVTAASVAVAGLTDSPDTIIRGNEEEAISSESFKEVSSEINDIDQDIDEEEDEEKKRKNGIKNRLTERMLSLPLTVRLFIIMPLWLLGTWILFISGSLLSLLSPFTGRIITTVIAALVVALLFYLGAKTVFPDLPLKKILNRKTLPWLLIGVLLINTADYFLEAFWADYQNIQKLIKAIGYLILLIIVFSIFVIRELKRRRKLTIAETEAEEIEEEDEEKPLIVTVGDETYSIITPKKDGKPAH